MRFIIFTVFAALALQVAPAHAYDSHTKPDVKPIYKTVNGEKRVVGAKITTILKSDGGVEPRLHIGTMELPANEQGIKKWDDTQMRHFAIGKRPGYMLQEFRGLKFQQNGMEEVSVDVIYGEGNHLKAGDKVDFYSTWDRGYPGDQIRHVWGMNDGPVNKNDAQFHIILPGEPNK
jgi:hypothetical protein